jgi:hypothetical protein
VLSAPGTKKKGKVNSASFPRMAVLALRRAIPARQGLEAMLPRRGGPWGHLASGWPESAPKSSRPRELGATNGSRRWGLSERPTSSGMVGESIVPPSVGLARSRKNKSFRFGETGIRLNPVSIWG